MAIRPYVRGADPLTGKIDNVVCGDELLILQGGLDPQLSILDEDILICIGSDLKLSVAVILSAFGRVSKTQRYPYPKPPLSTSLVHIFGSKDPLEKSS
jgi:hypothetical protein